MLNEEFRNLHLSRRLSNQDLFKNSNLYKNLIKKNRLIYLIHSKINQDDIEELITKCEIDFFSIDTTNFIDVQEYYQIIENIQRLCQKHEKQIGIIVELKGRKIKVEKFKKEQNIIFLKQGQTVKVVTHAKNTDNENLVIDFKELYKMLSPGDKIIINENKASLTVQKIVETCREKAKTRYNSPSKIGSENELKKKHSIGTFITMKNRMLRNSVINNYSCQHLNTCQACRESHENAIKTTMEKISEKTGEKLLRNDEFSKLHLNSHIPRVRTSIEPDINVLLDKIENYDNYVNRVQEINDLKMVEFEQDHLFEVDEQEMKNIENKKIDGFIQSVADLSEQKYNEKKSKEEYDVYIEKLKDISSIKDEDINLNHSNNCLYCLGNNYYAENANPAINQHNDHEGNFRRTSRGKKQNKQIKRYEIVCTIDYDCCITNNSFLYIPDLNYKKFDIELLSPRQVAEIERLDKLNVDFLCISIADGDDINEIKSILSENTNLKIIASIPDFRTLKNLEEILNYSHGVVLSRTFQILNKNSKNNIIQLTKSLISKSRGKGKPIFSYLDLDEDILCYRKEEISKLKEVMYNIMDGMDGFFISINNPKNNTITISNHLRLLEIISNYFRAIQSDSFFDYHLFHIYQNALDLNSYLGVLCNLIRKYSESMKDCVITYYGDDREDLENFSKIRFKSFITVISSNDFFLNYAKLHFGIVSLKIPEISNENELEKMIRKKIDYETNIILFISDKKLGKRKIRILSDI